MSRRLSVLSAVFAFFAVMSYLSTVSCHKKNPTGPTGTLSMVCSASPESGRAPLQVRFTARAQGLNDEEQRRVVYNWSFGDGTAAAAATAVKDFLQGGTYNVTMTATYEGNKAVWTKTIQVDSDLKIVNCTAQPSSGSVPLTVQFQSRVLGNGQNPVTYSWDFGDGGTSSDAQPSHTYRAFGNYTARLTVRSGSSSAQYSVPVAVFDPLSVTCSESPTSGDAPLTVKFDANADSGGSSCAYSWDFDDGKPGSDQKSPTHRYDVGRFHNPTVTVTCGTRRGTCTQRVEVIEPLPTPLPTAAPTAGPTAPPTPTPEACLVITGAPFGTAPFYNPGTGDCWPRDPATALYADGSYSYCWNIGSRQDAYFVRTRLADASSTANPYLTFTVNVPVRVIIGVDEAWSDCPSTGTSAACPEYTWMTPAGFDTNTSWAEWVGPIPSGAGLFVAHQATHADFPAGTITLGPPGRTDPSAHTYVVVVIPARTDDTCSP